MKSKARKPTVGLEKAVIYQVFKGFHIRRNS